VGRRCRAAARVVGSAALVLVEGGVPLRPELALFDAMLEGWRRHQSARRLSVGVVDGRERLVRPVPGVHRGVAVAMDSGAGRLVGGFGRASYAAELAQDPMPRSIS
jgi:hypothetical protein